MLGCYGGSSPDYCFMVTAKTTSWLSLFVQEKCHFWNVEKLFFVCGQCCRIDYCKNEYYCILFCFHKCSWKIVKLLGWWELVISMPYLFCKDNGSSTSWLQGETGRVGTRQTAQTLEVMSRSQACSVPHLCNLHKAGMWGNMSVTLKNLN